MEQSTLRQSTTAVDAQFLTRWSPRSFRREGVSSEQLAAVFEAARWAPSCYNDQPWHIAFVQRDHGPHAAVAEVLVPGNRVWAAEAPVLGVLFSRRHFRHNGEPNDWAPFDTGAAGLSMALQAQQFGLGIHLMGGFDPEAAHRVFDLDPAQFQAHAAFALGHPGPAEALPEGYREKEHPSDRLPLPEIIQELKS